MGAFIIIGLATFFTIIALGVFIFLEERGEKGWSQAVNSPEYLTTMAYLLSDDVNAFGGRRKGSEDKTIEEIVTNGFEKVPLLKARYLNTKQNSSNK